MIHSDLLGPNGEQWNNSEASNSRKMIKPTRLDSQWVCLEGAKTKVFRAVSAGFGVVEMWPFQVVLLRQKE